MLEYNEVKEIKNLIKKGFDLELISFELDIPIEKVRQYKSELESIKKDDSVKRHSAREIIESKNKQAHLKFEQMREKYKKLFFKDNEIESKKTQDQTEQEEKLINLIMCQIEKIEAEMKQLSPIDRRKKAVVILTKLKKIEGYQLTIDQAERLNFLMQSEVLEKLNLNSTDKIDDYLNKNKKTVTRKLIEAIDIAQAETQDIEELKKIEKKITIEMQQNNSMIVGTIRTKIRNKILKINQQKVSDKIRNDVSEDIKSIIDELANGILDIQEANRILDEEARKKVESKPKNRFSLTEEQEKRQSLIQIKTILMEKPEQYNIENPETTIMQIKELCNGGLDQAIRTVVKNLTSAKKFKKAKEVCDKFSSEDNEKQFQKYIITLKKELRNDEIGDMVLKGINMNGTYEEERAYFELIEKGLKIGNVKLGTVSLGKSQDGSKNITLADVWPGEEQREREI